MFDCERAKRFLPPVKRLKTEFALYARVRRTFPPGSVAPFANGDWNCRDGESYASLKDPAIKIFHFTAIPTQPQLPRAITRLAARGQKHWAQQVPKPHPRKDAIELWEDAFLDALDNGYAPELYERTPFGKYWR